MGSIEPLDQKTLNNPLTALSSHPLRQELYQELHTRPFPVVDTPSTCSHLAFTVAENLREQEYKHICQLCERYSVNPPSVDATCFYQEFGEFTVRWEKHTEFSTYLIIRSTDSDAGFEQTASNVLPSDWLVNVPGQLITGQHILMLGLPATQPSLQDMYLYFEGQRLIACDSSDGRAQIWTAFRLHSDGFSRTLVFNRDLNACQGGRLLQQLLEIETYRIMALLGLPLAKKLGASLTAMDQALARVMMRISSLSDVHDERDLLKVISDLAAKVEEYRTRTNYRFSATSAYAELMHKRLEDFSQAELGGVQNTVRFLDRRFTPAVRTCESVQIRLEDLSRRITRAGDLLRTRIDVTLEAQNQALLESLDRRSKMQVHLQQAVEGLSVAAISYYLVDLFKIELQALANLGVNVNVDLAVGLSIPVVITCVWYFGRRVRKRIAAI